MVVFEGDLTGRGCFSKLGGEPGQRDTRLPCIREDSFANVDWSFAEGGGIPFGPGVVQGIDPDALLAPVIAGESRSDFSENSESDLHTYRPNSLIGIQRVDPGKIEF